VVEVEISEDAVAVASVILIVGTGSAGSPLNNAAGLENSTVDPELND
jgi:hypothetical protein